MNIAKTKTLQKSPVYIIGRINTSRFFKKIIQTFKIIFLPAHIILKKKRHFWIFFSKYFKTQVRGFTITIIDINDHIKDYLKGKIYIPCLAIIRSTISYILITNLLVLLHNEQRNVYILITYMQEVDNMTLIILWGKYFFRSQMGLNN